MTIKIRHLITALLLGTALLGISQPRLAVASDKPNVVIIYGDDVGFGDVGVNGCKLIPTPNIDRLASEGLNFRDAHSSSSTCTPSRFSLLTGIHEGRFAGVRLGFRFSRRPKALGLWVLNYEIQTSRTTKVSDYSTNSSNPNRFA
jgi:hypothetical protein